jgi:carbon monoxide dehydrogenase subunit G
MNVIAGFDLAEVPEGAKVAWTGEAQIFGRLTSLAGGLLQPLAKKNVEKLINGLKAALSENIFHSPESPEHLNVG